MSNMTKFIGGSAVFGQRVSNVETAVDALIGIPMPWAGATPPTNHLLLNGASFNKTTYPKLAAVYPSGTLPDMRGEFIRGADNGRGVDVGRALLSAQMSENLSHYHADESAKGGLPGGTAAVYSSFSKTYYEPGPDLRIKPAGGDWDGAASGLYSARSGGGESRPRNIAFNYIVRAA